MSKHDEGWKNVVGALMDAGLERRACGLEEALWDRGAKEISLWAAERELKFLDTAIALAQHAQMQGWELWEKEIRDKARGERGIDLE